MALTNAERQAAYKARRTDMLETLTEQNAALQAEVTELRRELDGAREKAHRLELAALKAQLKAQAQKAAKTGSTFPTENGRTASQTGGLVVPPRRPSSRRAP